MKNTIFTLIAILLLTLTGCTNKAKKQTLDQYKQTLELVQQAENRIDEINRISDPNELATIAALTETLYFDYDPMNLSEQEQAACAQLKERTANLRTRLNEALEKLPRTHRSLTHSKSDYLMNNGIEAFPIYLERGEKLYCQLQFQHPSIVKIYNANSHQLLKTYNKAVIDDSLQINNTAIYLVEIDPKGTQYTDIQITYQANSLDRLIHPKTITTETVEGQKGDFRAQAVKGVSMKNLFEEPRKFTLRGQLKAAFSGNYRAIVALQVPAGASDVLYSLRISTNEGDRYSDGKFKNNMDISYKKIKFLGLPLYESHGGSGLLNTLLGENQPPREEDAYINMYVFYNAAQAKKFQDGADPAKLQYNVDYSKMGTQSCSDRIPSKGSKTIYLGFLNERMRYNNYVWLEAVSAVPTTEYFTQKYTIQ